MLFYHQLSFYLLFIILASSISQEPVISLHPDPSLPFQQTDIKLIYSTSESKDIYRQGDQLGEKIIVYFNGKVEKYATYYQADDVFLERSHIFLRELEELNILFTQYNFKDYPDNLPKTNQIRWPNRRCSNSFAETEKVPLKKVYVFAFVGSEYYPSGFFEFLNKLEEKLNSIIK